MIQMTIQACLLHMGQWKDVLDPLWVAGALRIQNANRRPPAVMRLRLTAAVHAVRALRSLGRVGSIVLGTGRAAAYRLSMVW